METNREKNDKLLDSFLVSLAASNDSDCTIRSYRTSIEQFFDMYGDRDFLDVDYADAEDFKAFLYKNNKSPNTIGLRLAALRSFSRYVRRRVRKTRPDFENVFSDVDLPAKKNVRPKVIWEDEELITLIHKLNDKKLYTDACLLALDLYSGRRRTELRSLCVEDFADDRLICNGKLYQTREIKTKGRNGGKYLKCYVHADVKPYIQKYMTELGIKEGALFPDLNDSDMGTIAKRIDRLADKHFHWHAGRHTFTTALYNQGVPEDVIVDMVGWSSREMLKIYNDTTKEQKINRFFA